MTEHPTGEEPTSRRGEEFAASLPAVSDRSGRERQLARAGAVLMAVGVLVAVVAVVMSQASDNPLDQSTQLSLGIAGLAVACVGAAIFLRFSLGQLLRYWLLRLLHERTAPDPSRQRD